MRILPRARRPFRIDHPAKFALRPRRLAGPPPAGCEQYPRGARFDDRDLARCGPRLTHFTGPRRTLFPRASRSASRCGSPARRFYPARSQISYSSRRLDGLFIPDKKAIGRPVSVARCTDGADIDEVFSTCSIEVFRHLTFHRASRMYRAWRVSRP